MAPSMVRLTVEALPVSGTAHRHPVAEVKLGEDADLVLSQFSIPSLYNAAGPSHLEQSQ